MHELGIVIEVVNTVENFPKRNGITKIKTLVLQIGELSPVVRHYIEECYPAAVDGSDMLKGTELKIEILPGNVICRKCDKVFRLIEHNSICPNCKSDCDWEIISGKEFMIKEIVAC